MIKGKRKAAQISKESILEKISAYDIYRFYQGPFTINEILVNKHRGEKDPSLIIGTKAGGLTHKDFGDYSWRGDCFTFVQQIFKCDFRAALFIIDRDFNLGLGNNKVDNKPVVITWPEPEVEIKRPPLFQIVYSQRYSKEALDYWAKLGQGESDLRREKIYQPIQIWRNRRRLSLGDLMTFCYYYEEIDGWKIYRPFAPKKTLKTPMNQWKWDSNIPFDYIDNIKAITSDCQRVVVAKSKKDRMVLMKALDTECIIDVQAEDPACLDEENLRKILEIPERIIVSDNDKKGKEFSWWLTKEHGFKHCNVPDKYRDSEPKCTDFADLCYHYGMEKVIEHFKNKKFI